MERSYTVALVGFAQSETSTFESFFRLAARRPPMYSVQDEVLDAQVLVVNSDNAQALHLVKYADLPGKVLLIGHNDGGTGWALQRKPVKLVAVLGSLDLLVGARQPSADTQQKSAYVNKGGNPQFASTEPYNPKGQVALAPTGRPATRRGPESEFPNTRPMVRRMAAPPTEAATTPPKPAPKPAPKIQIEPRQNARPGVMGVTDFGGLEELPMPASPASKPTPPSAPSRPSRAERSPSEYGEKPVPEVKRGDVLLVAESLVEGRILHKRIKKYNLEIDWSREAKQALEMIKTHTYRMVVIDRLNGPPDAYAICRAAKQRKRANGQSSVVLMFAPTAGSMDRLKAGLAGSDAYLSRSVSEGELYRVLAQHRLVSLDGFENTNVGF